MCHQQHLDRQQVDEDHPLVLLTGAVTVLKGKGQEVLSQTHKDTQVSVGQNGELLIYCSSTTVVSDLILTQFEVTVKHCLSSYIVLVRDLLGRAVVVFQVGTVDGSDQRFTQVQLIDLQDKTHITNQVEECCIDNSYFVMRLVEI